jgi:nucleoid-associated protein YgaU
MMYTKLLAAAVVLIVGFALASLFPKRDGDVADDAPHGGVALRADDKANATPASESNRSANLGLPAERQLANWPEPLVATRGDAASSLREPPPMPAEYAALAAGEAASAMPGRAPERVASTREPSQALQRIVHKVVDGDSLAKLATTYLGDATLGYRICEANDGTISDPLVVGSELAIPPPSAPTAPLTAARPGAAQTRLVPVAPAQVMARE